MKKKYLIVVGGPTASGKTGVAIELAKQFNTSVLSADSRQFYREMNIGTAKPTAEELAAAPHHFINSLSIEEEYSVGDFERDAIKLLDTIFKEKNCAILAGGSGLFIRAICDGLDEFPGVPIYIKEELNELFEKKGIGILQKELKEKDPDYFAEADTQNPMRLLRALSICRATGQPFSSFRKREKAVRPFIPIYVLLEWERRELYERINQRVDRMMEDGLLEEAKSLFPKRQLNALQTVGYQELFAHFNGKMNLGEAVEKIKQNSRRYAKRQMTWFRKEEHWEQFSISEVTRMIEYLEKKML